MKTPLENIKHFRQFVLKQIDGLSTDQLNAIPKGYNNNIIWNLAHLVSTTQVLCYKRAGLPLTIDDKYVTPFLPSTKPDQFIPSEEITVIKELMISTIEGLKIDIEKQAFKNYTLSERIKEAYNIEVSTIEGAIEFLLYHEGYHSGYIVAMLHLVKTNQ